MNEIYFNTEYQNPNIDNKSNVYRNPYISEGAYVENLIQNNKGKVGKFYMSFPNRNEKEKTFIGVIEQAGKDHIIISEPSSGKYYLLLLMFMDYVEFDEKINYIQNY